MILLLISFVAGVLTVLAPCILPLLPVIVGGSLSDGRPNRRKALTIIAALIISVILFTLLLKASTLLIDIPEQFWKWLSGGIVLVIGLIMLFPQLWEGQLMARISAKSNLLLGRGNQKKSFWGDVIIGAALGPVFSSCSPTYFVVLANVLPTSPLVGFIYLLAYSLGLGLMLLLIALLGQRLIARLGFAANPRGWVKRVIAVIFIIVGLAVVFGLDKKLEVAILDGGLFDITRIEQKLLELNQ